MRETVVHAITIASTRIRASIDRRVSMEGTGGQVGLIRLDRPDQHVYGSWLRTPGLALRGRLC